MPALFFTGGTGFFGASLLKMIRSSESVNLHPTILSRNPASFAKRCPDLYPLASWAEGDICDKRTFPNIRDLDVVLHAAADSTNGKYLSNLTRFQQIVEGTRNVLDYAVSSGARRFLYISSGGVYGRQPAGLQSIPEDYLGIANPLDPANVYSVSKRIGEHLCALYAEQYGLDIIIARCFAFVGEDLPLNAHFAIGNFIYDALWRDEIIVNGDGTSVRSYLDQRDLAHWLLVLLNEGKGGEAYNVGSDYAITIADLACLVRDLISPGKSIRILGAPRGDIERQRYVPDIGKIYRDVGLKQTISLERSIIDAAVSARNRRNSR